nr:hypothetical protein [Tanacetum cinerariifolium]
MLSSIEPANVAKALRDDDWVSATQEELDQFSRLNVWRLVPRPEGKFVIKTKWIFKNKKDESSLVIRNKARLVAVVFQMDVKTLFLNEIVKEEVYVGQPPSFVSKQYPDHVYALDKALYGLKQAPRAWYDVLSQFLIESGFQKDLGTFSSVRRPKNSSVSWKKKWSSNTSNVDFSAVSHSKLNKDIKRYSRKDLLSCNNSHLGETRNAFVCNDAVNVSCNSRMCDVLDDNNFFIFNDESIRISPVSKMPFRKKPCDYVIVRFKSNMNKSLPRTVHKWLPKLQPLAEPVA